MMKGMALTAFTDCLQHLAPGFQCISAGDVSGKQSFIASITHRVGAPSDPATLELLAWWMKGATKAFEPLFRSYSWLTLFKDTRSDASALSLYPVVRWSERSEMLRQ